MTRGFPFPSSSVHSASSTFLVQHGGAMDDDPDCDFLDDLPTFGKKKPEVISGA